MKHIYWQGTVNNINSSLTVDEIKAKCSKQPLGQAGVGLGEINDVRKTNVAFVNDIEINNMLWNLARTVNKHSFGFEIEEPVRVQFAVYEKGDHYDWHLDTNWADPTSLYDRKVSIIIQLSEEDSYSGGELELDVAKDQQPFLKEKGSVLVFPSFIRHRVKPVTKGTRKSLVAWVEGRCFR